jgi:hypothetical protein
MITGILLVSVIYFLSKYWSAVLSLLFYEWIMILVFPAVGVSYYGFKTESGKYNVRKIGWLKPFIIGFVWAGLVTVYPILFYNIMHRLHYQFNWIGTLLFLKNFMFITILCIMFDIKDYAVDYIKCLRTFVVKAGLRKTIFSILSPLSLLGLLSFICYAVMHDFPLMRILLNVLPFLLLIFVIWSLSRRRPLLYYLVVVDGLMLIKAVCGTIGVVYF